MGLLVEAARALDRAGAAQAALPSPGLFRRACIMRESVLSSQIEGTTASLADLVRHRQGELPPRDDLLRGERRGDLRETLNCARALEHGLERMRSGRGLPLSLRLLREVHGILTEGARGGGAEPGELRRTPVRVGGGGGVVLAPPPPDRLAGLLGNLEEQFRADAPGGLLLERAAILHGQFEMIRPFLDGGGRVGRILIPLFLCSREGRWESLPLVSLHLKLRRAEYHEGLRGLRDGRRGDAWERWVAFFLEAARDTAEHTARLAERLRAVIERDEARVRAAPGRGDRELLACGALQEMVCGSASQVAEATGRSYENANLALRNLLQMGVVEEVSGRARNRVFVLPDYLRMLNEGTDEPPG